MIQNDLCNRFSHTKKKNGKLCDTFTHVWRMFGYIGFRAGRSETTRHLLSTVITKVNEILI